MSAARRVGVARRLASTVVGVATLLAILGIAAAVLAVVGIGLGILVWWFARRRAGQLRAIGR